MKVHSFGEGGNFIFYFLFSAKRKIKNLRRVFGTGEGGDEKNLFKFIGPKQSCIIINAVLQTSLAFKVTNYCQHQQTNSKSNQQRKQRAKLPDKVLK